MNIGQAIDAMYEGYRLTRKGWNGKGMYLILIESREWRLTGEIVEMIEAVDFAPFVAMRTADGKLVPWLCSQTDLLAKDWERLS